MTQKIQTSKRLKSNLGDGDLWEAIDFVHRFFKEQYNGPWSFYFKGCDKPQVSGFPEIESPLDLIKLSVERRISNENIVYIRQSQPAC